MSTQPTMPPTSRIPVWSEFRTDGTQAILEQGYAATQRLQKACNENWFSSNSTIILGMAAKLDSEEPKTTKAKWLIPIPKRILPRINGAILAIACKRRFGGLHSKQRHARVIIQFNFQALDTFELKIIPEGHSDYFHRDLLSNLPADCSLPMFRTVYTWPIEPVKFKQCYSTCLLAVQTVSIEIDPSVSWDIDEVVLLIKTLRLPIRFWVITIILVAFSGLAATLIGPHCH